MKYQIRKAVLSDAKSIAKVHINSWKSTYKGIISEEFLNKMNIERGIERWKGRLKNPSEKYQTLTAVDDQQQIIGFIDGGLNRGEKVNTMLKYTRFTYSRKFKNKRLGAKC